jgi:hypothetical protein
MSVQERAHVSLKAYVVLSNAADHADGVSLTGRKAHELEFTAEQLVGIGLLESRYHITARGRAHLDQLAQDRRRRAEIAYLRKAASPLGLDVGRDDNTAMVWELLARGLLWRNLPPSGPVCVLRTTSAGDRILMESADA